MALQEPIDKLFSMISDPINELLTSMIPSDLLRPIVIILLSYIIAVGASGKIEKFKWLRRLFLTFVVYLAFNALGIQ